VAQQHPTHTTQAVETAHVQGTTHPYATNTQHSTRHRRTSTRARQRTDEAVNVNRRNGVAGTRSNAKSDPEPNCHEAQGLSRRKATYWRNEHETQTDKTNDGTISE
jgi:hypothetical protein